MGRFWITKSVGKTLQAVATVFGFVELCASKVLTERNSYPYWRDLQLGPVVPVDMPKNVIRSLRQPFPFTHFDTTGFNTVTLIATTVPTEALERVLPPEMELCACDTKPGQHPVFYSFGFQQLVKPLRCRFPLYYLEIIVGIPCVRLKRPGNLYAGPFIYLPALYLNRVYATLLGRAVGYLKHVTWMDTTNNTMEVRGLWTWRKIVKGEFSHPGTMGGLKDYPDVNKVIARLRQPIISRLFRWNVFTYLDWRFQFSIMQPVDASLTVSAVDFPTLPPGIHTWKGMVDDDHWACRMFVPWDFVFPFGRDMLEPGLACQDKLCPLVAESARTAKV